MHFSGKKSSRDGSFCGYSLLRRRYCQSSVKPRTISKASKAVNRRVVEDGSVLFPTSSVPNEDDLLGHILFAIRHEGINLQILSEALPLVSEEELSKALKDTPSGTYLRKAGYLWELFTGRRLAGIEPAGRYVELFDSNRYFTDPEGVRNSRWHVIWNGLGTPDWCATVEKTPFLIEASSKNILQKVESWFEEMPRMNTLRALEWAYLNETRGSFELEGESMSGSRENRFIALLRQADREKLLSEDYLCDLQNEIVASPWEEAYSFRNEQNWLSNGMHGAFGVRYVPPSPCDLPSLAEGWLRAANTLARRIDPLIAAAVISFGFVYLHPFMDGNGRLSRFLIHQQIAVSGVLQDKMLLPVSVSMKRHEDQYFDALTAFSAPCRDFWDVVYTGGEPPYSFSFRGKPTLYQYWDATLQTEFLFRMAFEAFDIHLKEELLYLERFDAVYREADRRFDVRQNYMHTLVNAVLDNNGILSKNIRKKFADRVPPALFDVLEEIAGDVLRRS